MYRSILVPLDGSAFAEQALGVAVATAKASGARVTLVRAWDPANYRFTSELTPPYLDAEAPDRLEANEYLEAVASRLRSTSDINVDVAIVAGRAADAIDQCGTQIGADLVVMTTHGRTGWSRAWLGSVADAIVRMVAIPVLLCRPIEDPGDTRSASFTRVLIPLDGSTAAEQILDHALDVGNMSGASYTLVRVVRPVIASVHPYTYAAPAWQTDEAATEEAVSHARHYLNATADSLKARAPGATIETDVRLDERVGAAIVDAARDHKADLVVLTTHARRGVRLVLGSVADKVLRATDGAILVLHPSAD